MSIHKWPIPRLGNCFSVYIAILNHLWSKRRLIPKINVPVKVSEAHVYTNHGVESSKMNQYFEVTRIDTLLVLDLTV